MIIDFIVASLALWVFWIATANTVSAHRRRNYTGFKLKALKGLVYTFIAVDVVFNVTYGTIVFQRLPTLKTLTLTDRLKDILHEQPYSWRWEVAHFVCRRMISPWDWNHCGLDSGR